MDGIASTGVSVVIGLLIGVMAVAVASKYIRIPYTIALVLVGLAISLTPFRLPINLTPDLILFIFLPALLFEASYNISFAELRENLRPITFLAVPGVLLTAVILAAVMYFAAGVNWGTAFLFGAIMSATDPVSVLAIFRQMGAPRRLSLIIEGESLFNDGTSIVIFRIVLGVVVAQSIFDPVATVGQFLFVVLGGLALGGAIGYVVSLLHTRVDDYLIETTMTLVVAYGTYLLAERLHVSGVIAVVVAALVLGNFGRATAMSATTRLAVASTWELFGFLANSVIFLLIGLELNIERLMQFWLPTLVAIAAVLGVRVVVVMASSVILKYLHRSIPYRWQTVLVWGGLRGAVALAMALSLPFTLDSGAVFPNRDMLQVMTFGVILFTLLVQGVSMEWLLRKLEVIKSHGSREDYQVLTVRRAMATTALSEIEDMERSAVLGPDMAAVLRSTYSNELSQLDEEMQAVHLRDVDLKRDQMKTVLRRILQSEKNTVRQRNIEGVISEHSMHHLLGEIDSSLRALDDGELPIGEELFGGEEDGDNPENIGAEGINGSVGKSSAAC